MSASVQRTNASPGAGANAATTMPWTAAWMSSSCPASSSSAIDIPAATMNMICRPPEPIRCVVVRRVAVANYRREPVPPSYAALMRDLAVLAERVADELVADRMATAVIDDLVALGRATADVEHSADLSAEVILAQVRSIIADLLALCGMDPLEATDVIPLR